MGVGYLSHKKYKRRLELLRSKKVDSEPHLVKNYPVSGLVGNSKRQTNVADNNKHKNVRDKLLIKFGFMSKLFLSPSEKDNSNKTFVEDLKSLVKNKRQIKAKDYLLAKIPSKEFPYRPKILHIRKRHPEHATKIFRTKQQRSNSKELRKENNGDMETKNTEIKCTILDKPEAKKESEEESEDNCNTVIEHSCDNDYSMIFNSLNENSYYDN